jgi:hypothetical protein
MTMTATYAKLKSGNWGVRVQGGTPAVGESVTVTKRDGTSKTETVAAVVYAGDGYTLCAIGSEGGTAVRAGRKCRSCGVSEASLRKPYEKILRNGQCSGCYRDSRDGYDD